jgi:hypothetical protein
MGSHLKGPDRGADGGVMRLRNKVKTFASFAGRREVSLVQRLITATLSNCKYFFNYISRQMYLS